MKHTITFTCETITPMFLSGADGQTPELRPPSIKGALRFWWRAMNGHLSLEELKKKEDEIFGGTEGRSKVIIRVKILNELVSQTTIKSLKKQALTYMAYGAEERKYFDVGTRFQIVFVIKESNQKRYEEIENDIRHAFSLLTNLGGLGAKSRNGFGSFICDEADDFETIAQYEVFNNEKNPFFSSITDQTEIYQSLDIFENWEEAITQLKTLYADKAKKSIFPKNDRKYIAAPYKNIPIPARHAKLHLMSLTMADDESMIFVITHLPYDYMKMYENLNPDEIQTHKYNWEKVTKSFNKTIENAKNSEDDFFVNFTFKETE